MPDNKSPPLKDSAPHSATGALWLYSFSSYSSGPDSQGLVPDQGLSPSFMGLRTIVRLRLSGEVGLRGFSRLRMNRVEILSGLVLPINRVFELLRLASGRRLGILSLRGIMSLSVCLYLYHFVLLCVRRCIDLHSVAV